MKKVAVIMGSDSDLPIVEKGIHVLKEYGVPYEVHVYSAHRTPKESAAFAAAAFCAAIESDTNCAAIAFIKSSPCFLHVAFEFTQPATIGFATSIFAHPPPEHFDVAQRKINELQFPKSAAAVGFAALLRGFVALFHWLPTTDPIAPKTLGRATNIRSGPLLERPSCPMNV